MKKNKRIKVFAWCSVLAMLFCVLSFILLKWWQTGNPIQPETVMAGIVFCLNFIIIGSIGYKIFKVNSSKSPAQLKKRIVYLFFFFILIDLLISLLIVSLGNYVLFYLAGEGETGDFIKHLFNVELPIAIKRFSIWLLTVSVFLFYMLWSQTISREHRLREENLKYQYRTLKTQINPHFLFNSMNVLSELVYVDTKRAELFIQKLSGIYRYILDNEETEQILLSKELEFVRQYIDLQKERNEDKIQISVDVENADDFKVIPVSLQLLVENALKHNLASEKKPLKIRIYNDIEYVVVSNNIQRKNILNESLGTGLPNLKERTKLITGKELIIIQEHNQFIVKLPITSVR